MAFDVHLHTPSHYHGDKKVGMSVGLIIVLIVVLTTKKVVTLMTTTSIATRIFRTVLKLCRILQGSPLTTADGTTRTTTQRRQWRTKHDNTNHDGIIDNATTKVLSFTLQECNRGAQEIASSLNNSGTLLFGRNNDNNTMIRRPQLWKRCLLL